VDLQMVACAMGSSFFFFSFFTSSAIIHLVA
jgi:hypothetical protein